MLLRIHYNFDLKGGAEYDILKLLSVFERSDLKNYLLLLNEENGKIKSMLYGHDLEPKTFSRDLLDGFLNDLIESLKIDIIHAHSLPSIFILKSILDLRLPIFRSMHEAMIVCPGWSKYWLKEDSPCKVSYGYKCLFNAYIKKCTRSRKPSNLIYEFNRVKFELEVAVPKYKGVLVYSNYMKMQAIQSGIPESKIFKIPSPQFDNFPDLRKKKVNKENISIIFVGRLSRQKGVSYLIKAGKLLIERGIKNFKIEICGNGPESDRVKNLVQVYKMNEFVNFHGWLSRSSLQNIYQQADISVIPSTYPDNFPNAVAESMLAGLTVVAFDSGGTCEWFDDGKSGIKICSKNEVTLCKELESLIKAPSRIKQIGENARNKIKSEHSINKTYTAYQNLYNNCR
ncbi:MAG: hypothetical protein CMP48_15735 [Rickettsiales bacterium]|nr:hypothetical protein [Rickettsiales bacterium]